MATKDAAQQKEPLSSSADASGNPDDIVRIELRGGRALDVPRTEQRQDSGTRGARIPPGVLAGLFHALSPSSRQALGRADALRERHSRRAVHMEHLLVALLNKADGPMRGAFDAAGVPPDEVSRRLALLDLDAPPVYPGDAIQMFELSDRILEDFPPLSGHVQLAFAAAARNQGWDWTDDRIVRDGAEIRTRHLTQCIASTRVCNVVLAFDDVWPFVLASGSAGVGSGAGHDRAEQATDRLGFSRYVRAFADLLESPDTTPPLTIGIFGSWGAGKSFLLWHIRDELRQRNSQRRAERRRNWRANLIGMLRSVARGDSSAARRPRRIHAVAFNAWEYNATERIWPRLVRAVLDTVERDVQWYSRPVLALQRIGRKIRHNLPRKFRTDWADLVAWLGVGIVLGIIILRVPAVRSSSVFEFVFGTSTIDDKFTFPVFVGALTAFAKLLKDTLLTPLGGWVTALLDDGVSYGGQIDYMSAIKADLDLLERRLTKGKARVLIAIDDLDRCEPDKIIQVLQATNLLLDRSCFVICLGIDARIVTAAVEKHYDNLLGSAGMSGYEYLDKIVQIPFRIPEPTPDELASLLAHQLGDPKPIGDAHAQPRSQDPTANAAPAPSDVANRGAAERSQPARATSHASDDTGSGPTPGAAGAEEGANNHPLEFKWDEYVAFRTITPYLRPNPRHVKRLVNVYALVRSLAKSGLDASLFDHPASVVRWLALCGQWPYAASEMLAHMRKLQAQLAVKPEETSAVMDPAEPPLPHLYNAVKDSLDAAKRARFDHDTARLEQLIDGGRELSWRELRALRRYTVNFNPALENELRADNARIHANGAVAKAALEAILRAVDDQRLSSSRSNESRARSSLA